MFFGFDGQRRIVGDVAGGGRDGGAEGVNALGGVGGEFEAVGGGLEHAVFLALLFVGAGVAVFADEGFDLLAEGLRGLVAFLV